MHTNEHAMLVANGSQGTSLIARERGLHSCRTYTAHLPASSNLSAVLTLLYKAVLLKSPVSSHRDQGSSFQRDRSPRKTCDVISMSSNDEFGVAVRPFEL